jgi:hypothetical protein
LNLSSTQENTPGKNRVFRDLKSEGKETNSAPASQASGTLTKNERANDDKISSSVAVPPKGFACTVMTSKSEVRVVDLTKGSQSSVSEKRLVQLSWGCITRMIKSERVLNPVLQVCLKATDIEYPFKIEYKFCLMFIFL